MYQTIRSPVWGLITCLSLSLGLSGCEYMGKLGHRFDVGKLSQENKDLKEQVEYLTREMATYKDELLVKDVTVSLYVLQRAVESWARDNGNHYPNATSLVELQTIVQGHLPPKFEINALYVEEIMSKPTGYLIIANVKDHKIVMSNLKS